MFQSPSLRGSGRFRLAARSRPVWRPWFQSPSLRGSGRFGRNGSVRHRSRGGFNPLHCGAVVASRPLAERRGAKEEEVSIPFIAGQWSLQRPVPAGRAPSAFQSPSLRGSGRFKRPASRRTAGAGKFQSPSLRGSGRFRLGAALSEARCDVSIPFIAGQWSLRRSFFDPPHGGRRVSIPFIAGQWSLLAVAIALAARAGGCFNPLHCGAVVASGPRAGRS